MKNNAQWRRSKDTDSEQRPAIINHLAKVTLIRQQSVVTKVQFSPEVAAFITQSTIFVYEESKRI
jgi:hypothetical protein